MTLPHSLSVTGTLACTVVGLTLALPSSAKEWRVFLLAGQSNMEGVGVAAEAPSNLLAQADVRLYHSPSVRSSLPANQWNPLKPAGISAANFGPELASAFRLAEAFPGENIALIKHAKGGTKLTTEPLGYEVTSWHPGTSPADTSSFGVEFATFAQTVTNALAALRAQGDTPHLSGMFWVQGEADATDAATGAAYGVNLARFVRRVREQFDAPDLPFVCARILPYQTRPGSAAVRQALADADQDSGSPAALSGVFTVHTEGLGVNADAVHFNTPGQLALGTLLADSLCRRGFGLSASPTPQTVAYWQLDEATGAAYLLDATGVYHLDNAVSATAAPPLAPRVAQPARPRFIDGTAPQSNAGAQARARAVRRLYDAELDMRDTAWTFEAFFKNNAGGTQTVYEVIGGTRSALSQYHGWRVIMINGRIRFFATANHGQTAQVLSPSRYDDGLTHHVAAVWDPAAGPAGTLRLYLDGVLAGEAAGVGDLGDAATYAKLFALGANLSGTSAAPLLSDNIWNGTLDEIRFTAAALAPEAFLTALDDGTVLRLTAADPLDRIYTDRAPCAAQAYAHVPRGGRALFPFVLRAAPTNGTVTLTASPFTTESGVLMSAEPRLHVLREVRVEANYGGCAKTRAGSTPPRDIAESVVRLAPFDVYEVLTDETSVALDGRFAYASLVRIDIPRNALPGEYRSCVAASLNGRPHASAPITLRVYRTALPESQKMDITHWLWPEPQNLTDQEPPEWWSTHHWHLLEAAGNTLRDYGDNVMFTPLFLGEHPLIPVTAQGSEWRFEFGRFDRWIDLFEKQGFRRFIGQHVRSHLKVHVRDSATGATRPLATSEETYQHRFLPAFLTALNAHLRERHPGVNYLQALWDEPKPEQEPAYRLLTETVRRHLPSARTVEALNHAFGLYSGCVDVPAWWYGYVYSRRWPELIDSRIAEGRENWIYHACTPRPPHPNTHLDAPLWRCRALPWVAAYCRATGYLHWAANGYRGANPYAASIGPLPNGSTAPGHPPGDNWLFYPTARGLTGSLRMAAFQQGVEDADLLTLLHGRDPQAAAQISKSIIRDLVLDYPEKDIRADYANVPRPYHDARQRLLSHLDNGLKHDGQGTL
jgi:iduronate 2-sulfatase